MKDISYSIEEILVAVNELQNSNNPKKKTTAKEKWQQKNWEYRKGLYIEK